MTEGCKGVLTFQFPQPPEFLPPRALKEAEPWRGLDDFNLLVQLEEKTGLQVEIVHAALSPRIWGFAYVKRELGRCRIYLNRDLSLFWQRFALFHEIHHLLNDSRGCYFWSSSNVPMSSFEYQADQFAWAVVLGEEEQYGDL